MSLGTFRRKPIRRRWVLPLTLALLLGALTIIVASASGVLPGSPSKFEADDGNMVVDTAGNSDWNTVTGNANYVHLTDLTNNNDDSWKSGQKQDTSCPVIIQSGNPGKDDFSDIASLNETNTDAASPQFGHTFLYGATIRATANGTANENVELNKGTNGTCPGTLPGGGNLFQRSAGDKLIAIDYSNGGKNVTFNVLTWIVDNSDPNNATCFVSNDPTPCWGVHVDTLSSNAAEGFENQAPITAANNGISGAALVTNQFAEFGIDLTAAGIIPANSCQSFPQTLWQSRSSTSFTSNPEDISVEQHTIGAKCTSSVATNPQKSTDGSTFTNLANNASLQPGVFVRDQATVAVTGVNVWGGNVDFYLCKSTTSTLTSCDPAGANATQIGGDVAVSNSAATATSTSTQPTVGSYCWAAKFTPNASSTTAGVPPSSSTTGECFSVVQIPTTTHTTPSPVGGTTTFGSSVTDHAVVTATQSGDGAPTGTVTFFICDPTQTSGGACPDPNGTQVGSPVTTTALNPQTTPPGSFADSIAVTVNKTGTWCWRAVYTPGGANGGNYTGSGDASAGECFTVTDTTGSTSAQDWLPNDTAIVTAGHGAPLNGTLSAQLYTGGSCGVSGGSAVSGQLYTKTLTGATSAADRTLTTNNTTFTVTTSGTSTSWLVTFTSSDPNVANSTHCESSTLTITN
jgi:hypothetical protein